MKQHTLFVAVLVLLIMGVGVFSPVTLGLKVNDTKDTSRADNPILLTNNAYDIYVDDNKEAEWYNATHVRTIQEGIENASHYNKIFVYKGVYKENLLVNKRIELYGEGKNSTIIDGSENTNVISIFIDGVTIDGFTIKNSSKKLLETQDNSGILVVSDYNKISNNIITQNLNGISITNSANNTICDNIIKENNYRRIILMGKGITIADSYNNTIENNNIYNSPTGISVSASKENIISKNSIFDTSIAIYLSNNMVTSITSENNTLIGNKILRNKVGIEIMECINNKVFRNTIKNNKVGIELIYSMHNNVSENNFIFNIRQARFVIENLNHINNTWDKNYWNRARTMPKMIIGYKLVTILTYTFKFPVATFDRHPAKEPYNLPE